MIRLEPLDGGDSSASGHDADPGAHLDSVVVEGDRVEASQGPAERVLSPDQFAAGLASAFQLTGALLSLQTIASAPERGTFPPAALALYECAESSPYLRWLISPESVWLQRTIAIGAFAVPVAVGTAAELRARRAAAEAEAAAAAYEHRPAGEDPERDGRNGLS